MKLRTHKSTPRRGVLGVATLAAALTLTACQQEQAPTAEVIRPVKSVLVEAPSTDRTRSFPGKVQATDKVDLAFQVSGQVRQLPIRKGQQVEKGETLARLDARDYRSDLNAALAEFNRATADYNRAAEIFKKRLISASDVDKLKAARDVAAANVSKARKALGDTTLKAPFAGVIANLYVDNFQDVRAKDPVLSLQDNSRLDIQVQVPENIIMRSGRDRGKQAVDLFARFESFPDQAYALTIKEFSTEADPDTQTFEFVLSMAPPTEINALPGMTVTVEATPKQGVDEGFTPPAIFTVPASAVFSDPTGEDAQFVWIISPEASTVQRRQVKIGKLLGDEIEILQGIEVGERLVTAGAHFLQSDQRVRILEGKVGAN